MLSGNVTACSPRSAGLSELHPILPGTPGHIEPALSEQSRVEGETSLAIPRKSFSIDRIWTIGHSTRDIDVFIAMLEENGIKMIADVRMFPGSKRYPQFNRETLAKSLSEHGIGYEHFPELGGRRKAKKDSRNTAWRNEGFRGYADYMETDEFKKGIERLLDLAKETGPTAIMCAEAVWWRCHRSLISDFLKARGIDVTHIVDRNKNEPHPFTSAARIVNGELSYAAESLL